MASTIIRVTEWLRVSAIACGFLHPNSVCGCSGRRSTQAPAFLFQRVNVEIWEVVSDVHECGVLQDLLTGLPATPEVKIESGKVRVTE